VPGGAPPSPTSLRVVNPKLRLRPFGGPCDGLSPQSNICGHFWLQSQAGPGTSCPAVPIGVWGSLLRAALHLFSTNPRHSNLRPPVNDILSSHGSTFWVRPSFLGGKAFAYISSTRGNPTRAGSSPPLLTIPQNYRRQTVLSLHLRSAGHHLHRIFRRPSFDMAEEVENRGPYHLLGPPCFYLSHKLGDTVNDSGSTWARARLAKANPRPSPHPWSGPPPCTQ